MTNESLEQRDFLLSAATLLENHNCPLESATVQGLRNLANKLAALESTPAQEVEADGLADVLARLDKASAGEWWVEGFRSDAGFESYQIRADENKPLLDTLNSEVAIVIREGDEDGDRSYDMAGYADATAAAAAVNWLRKHGRSLSARTAPAMTVIDPAQWEPCSPAYLSGGGSCDAPRVWNAETGNHWHPKRTAPAEGDAVRGHCDYCGKTYGRVACCQSRYEYLKHYGNDILPPATTAPVVALEQFREAVLYWQTSYRQGNHAIPDDARRKKIDEADRLIALIDTARPAKAEGDAQDAARYRWLRDNCASPATLLGELFQDDWDSAIDRHIAAAENAGKGDV